MKNLFKKLTIMAGGLALCLTAFMLRTPETATAQTPAGCIQFGAPLVTHGFLTGAGLPNGDQFLLGSSLGFTVVSPSTQGGSKFTVNAATFGSNPGFAGTTLEGLASSTPSSLVRAISCLDNYWDLNFYLATTGATEGDMVTIFLQNPDGTKTIQLAMFTITGGNAKLTALNSDVSLHLNDRFARGSNAMRLDFNNLAPFSQAAGSAGKSTQLLTIAFSMSPNAAVMGCFQLGIDIKRAAGAGTTSVVINDVVVNRTAKPTDVNNPGKGLLGGLGGGYPTGLKCDVVCPPCPPASGGGGGPTPPKCHVVCFQSDEYFRTKFECLEANTFLCNFNVIVPGLNFNNPVNVCRCEDSVRFALKGGALFGGQPRSAYWLFVQQYVTAQLGFDLSASGPARYDALWGGLSCYNVPAGTFPVTLSNGATISSDSMLKDLFMQAQLAVRESRISDMEKLGKIFLALNGNSFGYSTCNSINQFN